MKAVFVFWGRDTVACTSSATPGLQITVCHPGGVALNVLVSLTSSTFALISRVLACPGLFFLFMLPGLVDCYACFVGDVGTRITHGSTLLLAHFRKARWVCIYETSMTFSATETYWSYKQTLEKATSYNYSLTWPRVNREVAFSMPRGLYLHGHKLLDIQISVFVCQFVVLKRHFGVR